MAVSTISEDSALSTAQFKVFKYKKEYANNQLTMYKTNRIRSKMHAPYKISSVAVITPACASRAKKGEGKLLKKPCL